MARFRSLVLETVEDGDLVAIIRTLVRQAVEGDPVSANLVLDRCLGKPRPLEEEKATCAEVIREEYRRWLRPRTVEDAREMLASFDPEDRARAIDWGESAAPLALSEPSTEREP